MVDDLFRRPLVVVMVVLVDDDEQLRSNKVLNSLGLRVGKSCDGCESVSIALQLRRNRFELDFSDD